MHLIHPSQYQITFSLQLACGAQGKPTYATRGIRKRFKTYTTERIQVIGASPAILAWIRLAFISVYKMEKNAIILLKA